MAKNTAPITILERGQIYKYKDYYRRKFIYFCPSRKRNLDNLTWWNSYSTMVSTIFKATTANKVLKSIDVHVKRGFVKELNVSDYIKLNNILRKNGYMYNKAKKKLIKIET
jgi:hypothetical protein